MSKKGMDMLSYILYTYTYIYVHVLYIPCVLKNDLVFSQLPVHCGIDKYSSNVYTEGTVFMKKKNCTYIDDRWIGYNFLLH